MERESFKRTLPSEVQVQLDQPFGKDSCQHSFTSDVEFRHVLLFVFRSNLLSRRDRKSIESAWPLAKQLSRLLREYRSVDFRPLQGFDAYRNYDTETNLDLRRVQLATAALLHYNCNMATLVRYIGGPHVGAHRSVEDIMAAIDKGVNSRTKQ